DRSSCMAMPPGSPRRREPVQVGSAIDTKDLPRTTAVRHHPNFGPASVHGSAPAGIVATGAGGRSRTPADRRGILDSGYLIWVIIYRKCILIEYIRNFYRVDSVRPRT